VKKVKSLFLFLALLLRAFPQGDTSVQGGAGAAVSVAAVPDRGNDSLGSDYNLGRIPSESMLDNFTGWDRAGDQGMLFETFNCRTGRNGNFSFGVTPAVFILADGLYCFQFFPEFDFLWRIKNSNRFFVSASPMNLSVISTPSGSSTGFDMPFTSLQNYQWHFLSQGGIIHLKPENYDIAFFLGPQLNPGQFRNDVSLFHTINGDTVPLRLFAITLSPAFGISDGLQLGGNFSYSFADSVTNTWYTSGTGGDYRVYDKSKVDSMSFSLGLQYRLEHLFLEGNFGKYQWRQKQQFHITNFGLIPVQIENKCEDYRISLISGYLLGNRINEIGEVRGNWDGFFSHVIGKNQLFGTLGVEAVPEMTASYQPREYPFDSIARLSSSLVNLHQNIRYGISDHFEIAEQCKATLSTDSTPTYKLGLKLSTNNVPLRSYGPEQASNDEYFHGIWLKKSQWYGSVSYFLPFFKKVRDYQYLPVYLQVKSYGAINDVTDPFGRKSITNVLDLSQPGSTSMLQDADFSIQFSLGITDNISFSNSFDYGGSKYKKTPIDTAPWSPNYGKYYATRNTIVSNLSALSLHVGKSGRLILAVDYISQTDDNGGFASRQNTKNVAVLFLAQGTVPSKPHLKTAKNERDTPFR
jgi:hypothetical protein